MSEVRCAGHTTVRRGQSSDIDAAVDSWIAANADTTSPEHTDRLRAWAREPGTALFVAERNDLVVGMALLLAGRYLDGEGDLIPGLSHLTGVAVHPDFQRRRIGCRLVEAVTSCAVGHGAERVTLWARSDNADGQGLFKRMGFVATGRSARDAAGVVMVHLEKRL